uniref:Uncharacterized protein n=1 Tax=viral metagenome TaxID=1070528 RepID=A0A6C0CFK7_9ZZZZ
MTELNIAYSYNGDLMDNSNLSDNYESADLSQQSPHPSQQSSQQSQQPSQQSSQPPPQQAPIYQPSIPNFYPQQQVIQTPPKKQYQRAPEYSFWDRMAMSRNDVLKLFILSLIVVLGISIDRIGSHYIKQYLTDNVLSPIQEFIVRLSYPVIIFLFIWIIKSL